MYVYVHTNSTCTYRSGYKCAAVNRAYMYIHNIEPGLLGLCEFAIHAKCRWCYSPVRGSNSTWDPALNSPWWLIIPPISSRLSFIYYYYISLRPVPPPPPPTTPYRLADANLIHTSFYRIKKRCVCVCVCLQKKATVVPTRLGASFSLLLWFL